MTIKARNTLDIISQMFRYGFLRKIKNTWFLQIDNSEMSNDQFQSLFIEISQSLIQDSQLQKKYPKIFTKYECF